MADTSVRKLASRLLSSMAALSPPDVRVWAEAMNSELHHVQGEWEALFWAMGGMRVLMISTLICWIRKKRRGIPVSSARFADLKDSPVRRLARFLGWAAVAISFLLLLAPSLRQGISTSVASLHSALDNGASSEQFMLKLGAEAREQHDAAGMAFVALHVQGSSDRNEMESEAVKLNPHLMWIYAMQSDPTFASAGIRDSIRRLEAWDPENAVPYLVEADLIFAEKCREHNYRSCGFQLVENDRRWHQLMAEAFHARKYDSYLARRLDLDRSVMRRWRLHDPLLVFNGYWTGYGAQSIRLYAEYLLELGRRFAAGRDFNQAYKAYSAVAHFCEMVQAEGQTDFERMVVVTPQLEAYRRLQTLAELRGDLAESDLLAYEIRQLQRQLREIKETSAASGAFRVLAVIVQVATFIVLISLGMILFWLIGKCVLRSFSGSAMPGWRFLCSLMGMVGVMGLLFGLLTLYLSYQPYSEAFKNFMESKGTSQFRTFHFIFATFWVLPGAMERVWYSHVLGVYFWSGFIAIGTGLVILVLGRMIKKGLTLGAARKSV